MPGAPVVAVQDVRHLGLDEIPRGQAHGGVEVALYGDVGSDALAGGVEGNSPVDADDVGARVRHQAEQLAGADAEMDAWHVGAGQ